MRRAKRLAGRRRLDVGKANGLAADGAPNVMGRTDGATTRHAASQIPVEIPEFGRAVGTGLPTRITDVAPRMIVEFPTMARANGATAPEARLLVIGTHGAGAHRARSKPVAAVNRRRRSGVAGHARPGVFRTERFASLGQPDVLLADDIAANGARTPVDRAHVASTGFASSKIDR